MALFFSVVPAIALLRSLRPLVAHVVFALHFYTFLLLLLCVAITIPVVSAWFGGAGRKSESMDRRISIDLLIASSVFSRLSAVAAYDERGVVLVVKTGTLTLAVAADLMGYRFIVLLITLQST